MTNSTWTTTEDLNATGTTAWEDLDAILLRLDADFSRSMALVYVYVAMVMVTGLLGNLLVVAVYVTKFKATTTRCFIVALAVLDLISCLVAMPLDLVELSTYYALSSEGLCKLHRCVVGFTYICSGSLVLAVAIDRYRKICRPLSTQLTVRGAIGAAMGCVTFAAVFTWPLVLIAGQQKDESDGVQVTASLCDSVTHLKDSAYPMVYYSVLFAVFLTGIISTLTLYALICCKVRKRRLSYCNGQPALPATTSTSDVITADVPSDAPQDPAAPWSPKTGRSYCSLPNPNSLREASSPLVLPPISFYGENTVCLGSKHLHAAVSTFGRHAIGRSSHKERVRLDHDITSCHDNDDLEQFSDSTNPQNASMGSFDRGVPKEKMKRAKTLSLGKLLSVGNSSMHRGVEPRSPVRARRSQKTRSKAARKSTTFTLFLVALIYTLSFLPFFVVRALRGLNVMDGGGGRPSVAMELVGRFLYFQSAANPILYGIRHPQFRVKCRQLVRGQKT